MIIMITFGCWLIIYFFIPPNEMDHLLDKEVVEEYKKSPVNNIFTFLRM